MQSNRTVNILYAHTYLFIQMSGSLVAIGCAIKLSTMNRKYNIDNRVSRKLRNTNVVQ